MNYKINQVECPFYKQTGKNTITCEGVGAGMECTHRFGSCLEKDEYLNTVCSSNLGKKCHYYRMLSVLYERGIKK